MRLAGASERNRLITSTTQMKAAQVFGFVVAALASAWASFAFFRGSISGAPPLYSHGMVSAESALHSGDHLWRTHYRRVSEAGGKMVAKWF
jgi:hypothetical protein